LENKSFEQILVVMVIFVIIIGNCFIYHYLKKFWEILIEEKLEDLIEENYDFLDN